MSIYSTFVCSLCLFIRFQFPIKTFTCQDMTDDMTLILYKQILSTKDERDYDWAYHWYLSTFANRYLQNSNLFGAIKFLE